MKIKSEKPDYNDLCRLIERYFDAGTSLEEERLLRKLLASGEFSGKEVDEAISVMGLIAGSRSSRSKKRGKVAFTPRFKKLSAAASVAVALGVGITLFSLPAESDFTCIAYNGGVRVEDRGEVEALLFEQLNDASEGFGVVEDAIEEDMLPFNSLFDDADSKETENTTK